MFVLDLELHIFNTLLEMGDHQLAIFLQCLIESSTQKAKGASPAAPHITDIFSERIMDRVLRQIEDTLEDMRTGIKAQILFALTREGMKRGDTRLAKDGKRVINLIQRLETELLKDV